MEITSLLGCPPKKSMLAMLKKTLQTNTWSQDEQLTHSLKQPLLRLCARYLYLEKRRGFALNPVGKCAYLWISVFSFLFLLLFVFREGHSVLCRTDIL